MNPPNTAPIPQPIVPPPQSATATGFIIASVWARLGAAILDGVILAVVTFLATLPFTLIAGFIGVSDKSTSVASMVISQLVVPLLQLAIMAFYSLYFVGKKGATPGKMAFGLKIIKKDNPSQEIGYLGAFIREFVGKTLSSILLLGYITALGDPEKRTWHDKIAGTVVIKVKNA